MSEIWWGIGACGDRGTGQVMVNLTGYLCQIALTMIEINRPDDFDSSQLTVESASIVSQNNEGEEDWQKPYALLRLTLVLAR